MHKRDRIYLAIIGTLLICCFTIIMLLYIDKTIISHLSKTINKLNFVLNKSAPCSGQVFDEKKFDYFEQYELLRGRIASFSLRLDDPDLINKLFGGGDDALLTRGYIAKCLKIQLNKSVNYQELMLKGKYLYRLFLLQNPSKEVLYSYLQRRMADIIASLHSYKRDSSASPGMTLAWGWADGAWASIYGFQATKETRFLDLFITSFDTTLNYLDSKRGKQDAFRSAKIEGWGFALPQDSRWETEITIPGRILAPVLRFCKIVEDSRLLTKLYGKKAREYKQISLKILDQYINEMVEKDGIGYFVNKRNGNEEAINHQAAFVRACAVAYVLTKDPKYAKVVNGFLKYFYANLTPVGDTFSWPYLANNPANTYPEMFWKGSTTISALVECENDGFIIPTKIKKGIVNTFMQNICGRFATVNAFVNINKPFPITGYNIAISEKGGEPFFEAERLLLWIELSQFDPKVKDTILDIVSTRVDILPMGWFGELSDAAAYAYWLKITS